MATEPKKLILLEGGPLDGATIEADPHLSIDEVIFRTTEYYPARPHEHIYRLVPWGALEPQRLAQGGITGVRVFPYRLAEKTALVARVEAQDVELQRLRGEVDKLIGEVQRLQDRLQTAQAKHRRTK